MARNGTGKGGGLTARDAQLAGLVAGGSTYAEAAGQLKISERTVKRAMSRPEVRAEVDAIRNRAIEAGLGLLCSDFTEAITDLRELRKTGTPKDAVKLGAVKLTIEGVLKVRENVTLAREVAELRAILNEPAGGSGPPSEDRGGPKGEPGGGSEPGRTESGPGGRADAGGNDPGPVASEPVEGPVDAGVVAGFPASWQV